MIGQTLGQYQILSLLGEGGMGCVYAARDSKLGRDVALKVLPERWANDPQLRGRFEREAQTIAALNHPNIITIYSFEELDGLHFLTMELIDGETLASRITPSGVTPDSFFKLATPLIAALRAAHAKGVIHRDLKPANIMLTSDGQLKVLDFGLAKATEQSPTSEQSTTELLTESGVILGTVPYMSPEQTEARPLDYRSDVFSLGTILYELATGHRPFAGRSPAETISTILREHPPPIRDLQPRFPGPLAGIIHRCLEKKPDDRFQSAQGIAEALEEARAEVEPATGREPRIQPDAEDAFRIAVLPFLSRGSDPGLEDLAEGLAEDIIAGLTRFPYLQVISREATRKFDMELTDAREAGRGLGARYVIEGRLRQSGSRLRVIVHVNDTNTGAHLWAETFDRRLDDIDIFDLQDELSARVVSTIADMHGVLSRAMCTTLMDRPVASLNAHEAVIRSFRFYDLMSEDEHTIAKQALEHAVDHWPKDSNALAMLASMYCEEYKHAFNVEADSLDRALSLARRAIEADPGNYLAYFAQAQTHFFRGEIAPFKVAAEHIFRLNPLDGDTKAATGIFLSYAGEWERGIEISREAANLNPTHPGWYSFAEAMNAFRLKDYTGAVELLHKMNLPGYHFTQIALCASYAHLGDLESARKALRDLLDLKPDAGATAASENKRWLGRTEFLADILEGLRMAGLDVAADDTGF